MIDDRVDFPFLNINAFIQEQIYVRVLGSKRKTRVRCKYYRMIKDMHTNNLLQNPVNRTRKTEGCILIQGGDLSAAVRTGSLNICHQNVLQGDIRRPLCLSTPSHLT